MTVPEARARCAALEVLEWDDDAIAHAVTGVTATFVSASPQVTPAAGEPGLWWVGAGGFEAVGGERALAEALLALARRWHPRARVGVAESCVAARAATWSSAREAVCLVPPGGDAHYLAAAPLALLPMDAELRETLESLGIRRAGALAALAAEDVERRWGAEGLAAWRLARAEDARRPVLADATPERVVELELPAPTPTMEPVLFLVRAALDRLTSALVADGRAVATIAITLVLDTPRSALPSGGTPHTVTREVRLPRPVARVELLFEQCRALLDRWTLTAPVGGVRVAITHSAPLSGAQGDLLAHSWRDPAAADAAFARLRAELGPDAVVRPIARDDHRPEHAGAWLTLDEVPDDPLVIPLRPRPRTPALRLLETPQGVEIERVAGIPVAMWWNERRLPFTRASGPERLSGDWWKDEYARDYWRCESEAGAMIVFEEGLAWFVQGWED
jgi:nucleotidyltransferase/DNA polymerase involved in DNA repair